ncbi:enoyl-CoA hydratase-related protein [uncultured Williamsia sp.]|uniref:enoyl-CoA hydratase/isomerase family protein n=1 Tax=uncultured Williamsia sp. TaxID=259311 RepID=UPI00261F5000|nr:enoyl-CoA hydratase-related protein [uncultured Williamsia sp.]
MTDAAPVLTADDGVVRVITLNRPHVRNAIDIPLRVALADAIETAMADRSIRAIVLTGSGGTFCSGGDIATMERMPPEHSRPRAEAAQRVIRAIWTGPTPVVAAVEGAAFGAGTALALACDRVVASTDSIFGTTFTGVGLAGDMGIFSSLPDRVGPAAARQLLMFPRRVRGDEAERIGLVDATSEPGQALTQAMSDARRMAAGPPLALRTIKSILGGPRRDRLDVLDIEIDHQVRLFDSEDFGEGAAAFVARRQPTFTGR